MFLRFSLVCILTASVLPTRAQVPGLSLCSEEEFRSVAEIGGIYRLECSTQRVSISFTRPLVVQRDLTLTATQEVILNGQNLTRLFVVQPGVRLTLDRVLIFSGRQSPTNRNNGGIDDTAGGGIYNNGGIVTILNGRFEANSVIGITGQPGAAGSGDDGEEGGDAAGAAIFNNGGQIVVSNTVFQANTVTPGAGGAGGTGGGGLGGDGGNGGNGGSGAGAAIYSAGGRVTVFASVFTNNTAVGAAAAAGGAPSGFLGFHGLPGEAGDGVGAAVVGANAEIILSGSTFATNTVRGANGLAGNAGPLNRPGDEGRSGGEGAGGAVYSTGRLWITNCTFLGNIAIGGNGGNGGAGGTTGFGGDGGQGGHGGSGTGGAVESAGPATIVNCTFSANGVTPGNAGTGGAGAGVGRAGSSGSPGSALGGAIHGSGSEVIIGNNILAHSTMTISGNVSDRGGNLATDRNALIVSLTSFRLTNPFLQPLADNGGPTPTMAIQETSPAVDRGLAQFCPPVDQRGTNRITCDIGAYEVYRANTNLPPIPGEVLTRGLTALSSNNTVELRWPGGYTNLYLQFATNLNGTNWTTLTNLPSTTNGNIYVLAVNPAVTAWPQAFFRLFGLTNLGMTNLLFPNPIAIDDPPILR